jgi:adenylate cyclase
MMSIALTPLRRLFLFRGDGLNGNEAEKQPENEKASEKDSAETRAVFGRTVIKSEQRRMTILATLLTGLILLVVGFGLIAHRRGALPAGYGPIVFLGSTACIYQWLACRYLASALRRGIQPARFRFYLNALVELSVPTAIMWVAAGYTHPSNAITGPASYVYFLFIILSALRLDFRLCLFTGVVASVGYGFNVLMHWDALKTQFSETTMTVAFSFFVRALILTLSGLVAGLVSVRIQASLTEAVSSMRDRERVVNLFGQHVSPEVAERLLANSQNTICDYRRVCVLVLDIRNFTGFAENRAPSEVVALLNMLWDFMICAVNEHHGFINKFLGDGFLAVFGAPLPHGNDCQNAVAAARQILRELDERIASERLPGIQVGMAVHAGEAIVGSVGSAQRREYTVIGDVVNVAFRMEALNKDFGSRLITSEGVRREIEPEGTDLPTSIQIRGRKELIKVYPMA